MQQSGLQDAVTPQACQAHGKVSRSLGIAFPGMFFCSLGLYLRAMKLRTDKTPLAQNLHKTTLPSLQVQSCQSSASIYPRFPTRTFSIVTIIYGNYVHQSPTTFVFFWLHCWACGILVPQPGIEPTSPAVEAWSLNHWTTREVPSVFCY